MKWKIKPAVGMDFHVCCHSKAWGRSFPFPIYSKYFCVFRRLCAPVCVSLIRMCCSFSADSHLFLSSPPTCCPKNVLIVEVSWPRLLPSGPWSVWLGFHDCMSFIRMVQFADLHLVARIFQVDPAECPVSATVWSLAGNECTGVEMTFMKIINVVIQYSR